MADRCTPLFRGRGRGLRGGGGRPVPAFELAAMERLVGGFKLLHLAFQFPDAAPRLGQFRVALLQLHLVLGLQSGRRLIPIPNPFGGQPLKVRAPVPMGADKLGRQFREARHG